MELINHRETIRREDAVCRFCVKRDGENESEECVERKKIDEFI